MNKKFTVRMLRGLTMSMLTAVLLTTGVLAADCKHPDIEKGYCADCKTQFAARVEDVYYESVNDAVKAADKQPNKGVTLLTDLKNQSLKLGDVYLVVDEEPITIEKSTLKGDGPDAVVVNKGELVLRSSTITNKKGAYALLNEGGTTKLSSVTMDSGTVQVRVEGGKLQLETEPVDRILTVEAELPGVFAEVIGSAKDKAESTWVGNMSGRPSYKAGEAAWRMSDSISKAVQAEKEVIYTGEEQYPPVKIVLHNRELIEGEDYTLVCPAPASDDEDAPKTLKPVEAGTYDLRIEGMGLYSGTVETKFTIKEAEPAIKWADDTDTVTYTGKAAVPNVKVEVTSVDGTEYKGKLTYTYRTAGTGDDFVDGLPVNAGNYEVKAASEAFDNHTAAETEEALLLTIAPKTVTPTVKVTADGLHYTGKAHTPKVTLLDGDTEIAAKEYSVEYANNTNVGTASVVVTDKDGGNYVINKAEAGFPIGKAQQAALTITGTPAAVKYGDPIIKLGVSGGSTDGEVTWTVIEGEHNAAVDFSGGVNVIGVGKFTVQATMAGDGNYEPVTAQWSAESGPAQLTISSVEAADKVFDGTKTVTITGAVLSGVINNEDVSIRVSELTGEVADAKAGTYNAVKLTDVKLNGVSAKNYVLTQPEGGVPVNVTISKAPLTTALESIEVSLPIGNENVVVENLGGGMPKDAGTLTFTNRIQTVGEGTQAIVLKWGVDAAGKLTAQIANSKGGDKVGFEVLVASDNYETSVVKVLVSMGAVPVDASKVTITPAAGELVYNGQAQKPQLTVQYEGKTLTEGTDFEVKYPDDATSAGEKEVTVTFKGSYEGTATAKYTVAKAKLTVSGSFVPDKTYNGSAAASVTVGTVSGIVQGDDVKVTAVGTFSDKNSGSKTVTVTYKVEGKAAGNYAMAAETEALSGRIIAVTPAQLNAAISGITTANATTDNRTALQNVIAQADTALADAGLSTADKTNISNVKQNAENMLARVNTAASAAATDSIKATADINSDNVTIGDKAALEQSKSDLAGALSSYSGNYTAAEVQSLKNSQTRVDSALSVITRVQSAETLIAQLPDDMDGISSADSNTVKDAQSGYNALSDYEKTLLSQLAQQKVTAAGLADKVVDPENTPNQTIVGTDPEDEGDASEPQGEKPIQLPMGIFWLAVLLACLIALGFVWYKIKTRNKQNW